MTMTPERLAVRQGQTVRVVLTAHVYDNQTLIVRAAPGTGRSDMAMSTSMLDYADEVTVTAESWPVGTVLVDAAGQVWQHIGPPEDMAWATIGDDQNYAYSALAQPVRRVAP